MDLVPVLSHSWTYQALVHDVMDMKLNEIVVQVKTAARKWVVILASIPGNKLINRASLAIDRGKRTPSEKKVRHRGKGLFLEQECFGAIPSGRRGD